jgi:hypothetical protein
MKSSGVNRSTKGPAPETGPTATPTVDGLIIKGQGNSAVTAENGDFLLTVNANGEAVAQIRTGGAWDAANETILAAP